MERNKEELTGLEKGIQLLAQERGDLYAKRLSSILFTNDEKKRIEKWLDRQSELTIEDYVMVVAEKYDRYGAYLERLQIEKSEPDWEDLYQQLRKWAYNFFIKHGLPHGDTASDLADGCAVEAAMKILTAWFPFDVDFDPWVHVLLLNVCRHEVRNYARQSQIPETEQVELHDELNQSDMRFSLDGRFDQEMRYTVLSVIEQIPTESWQLVLILRYFDNLSPAEIAEELNKTPSAVYNLQFKAINAFREIWIQKGYRDGKPE